MSATQHENIFETASREKFRFPSIRGDLTVEQLWDTPLRGSKVEDFSLDSIAKTIHRNLRAAQEESFVETTKSRLQTSLEKKLELVKYVIDMKLEVEEAAARRAKNKEERETLLKILKEKQEGKMSQLSEREIEKRIAALND